jgi:hypothetical protein
MSGCAKLPSITLCQVDRTSVCAAETLLVHFGAYYWIRCMQCAAVADGLTSLHSCRFGRPDRAFSPFSLPRRPCPFGHSGLHDPDAMLKHMAAARFGPDLLSSLLAAAEVLPCCARARRRAVSTAMLPVLL